MLIFILCLYIIRANGFIVPTAALCVAWAALFVRWTLRFIAACMEVTKNGCTGTP